MILSNTFDDVCAYACDDDSGDGDNAGRYPRSGLASTARESARVTRLVVEQKVSQ